MSKRNLALFDIDKTIYDGYIIFPLAEYQYKKGLLSKEVLNKLYTDLALYKEKKIDYETTVENLNFHFIEGLKNKRIKLLSEVAKEFLKTKEGNKFFPFVTPLLSLLNKTHDIYFVTGELQFIGQAVNDFFKASGYISSEVESFNGKLTGALKVSLARRESKQKAIEHLFEKYPYKQSLAFGDSEGDIEMLNSVDIPICINATEGLKKYALSNGYTISTPDLIVKDVKNKLKIT